MLICDCCFGITATVTVFDVHPVTVRVPDPAHPNAEGKPVTLHLCTEHRVQLQRALDAVLWTFAKGATRENYAQKSEQMGPVFLPDIMPRKVTTKPKGATTV